MSQVTITKAQAQFSQLIRQALDGEEVVIVKGKMPLVRLVPVRNGKAQRKIGADKGLIKVSDDFTAPLDDFKEYMF